MILIKRAILFILLFSLCISCSTNKKMVETPTSPNILLIVIDDLGFSTKLFGVKARGFIQENKSNPFFLQLPLNAVHNFTHQLPEEYLKSKGLKGYHDWDPAKEDYYNWYQKRQIS